MFGKVFRINLIFKFSAAKVKIKTCGRLATADWSGQKNHNGKTTAVLLCNVFY